MENSLPPQNSASRSTGNKVGEIQAVLAVTELFQIPIISVHSLCLIKAKGIRSFLSSNRVCVKAAGTDTVINLTLSLNCAGSFKCSRNQGEESMLSGRPLSDADWRPPSAQLHRENAPAYDTTQQPDRLITAHSYIINIINLELQLPVKVISYYIFRA